ncbi:MAG: hypothetical protein KFE23_02415 [Candidatus Baumannia cicadellinicola]|nr:hypothetical protein [Candidatus Baumannia cicadellinicola]
MTDRPAPAAVDQAIGLSAQASSSLAPISIAHVSPGCSNWDNSPLNVSPREVRPFPKAGPRKNTNRPAQNRQKRETAILTDTPVKRKLEEEKNKRAAKKPSKELFKQANIENKNQAQLKKATKRPISTKEAGKKKNDIPKEAKKRKMKIMTVKTILHTFV